MRTQHVLIIPYQGDIAYWNGRYFVPRITLATRYKTRQTALAAIRNLRIREINNVAILKINS